MKKIISILIVLSVLFAGTIFVSKTFFKTDLLNLLASLFADVGDDGDGGGGGGGIPAASCNLSANPVSGTGPFDSQITATFSNLPTDITQASISCDQSASAINVAIQNGVAVSTCSYPQVQNQTLYYPRASAGQALCSIQVTNNPAPPDTIPPNITVGPSAVDISQTTARIIWTTDELSDSKINYGTAPGQYTFESYNATMTQSHNITLTSLLSRTTYYYIVRSIDGAGNATVSTERTFVTAAQIPQGGGGGSGNAPTDPSVVINEGAENVTTIEVALTLSVSANATQMMISNRSDFEGASWEIFSPIKFWTLTTGSGVKTVYVQFRDDYNNVSDVAADSINLVEIGGGMPESETTSTQETTILTTAFVFTRDLYFGIRGDDVKVLQEFLNKLNFKLAEDGFGSLGNETNFFGSLTKAAVKKFQEAHFEEILAPLKLSQGTGYFGPMTRKFINSLNLESLSGK